MPCGGIWTPGPDSSWTNGGPCWVCQEDGCELFCDEWDTPLHVRCLGEFLCSEEGRIVLDHGHCIEVAETDHSYIIGASEPQREGESCDAISATSTTKAETPRKAWAAVLCLAFLAVGVSLLLPLLLRG